MLYVEEGGGMRDEGWGMSVETRAGRREYAPGMCLFGLQCVREGVIQRVEKGTLEY